MIFLRCIAWLIFGTIKLLFVAALAFFGVATIGYLSATYFESTTTEIIVALAVLIVVGAFKAFFDFMANPVFFDRGSDETD